MPPSSPSSSTGPASVSSVAPSTGASTSHLDCYKMSFNWTKDSDGKSSSNHIHLTLLSSQIDNIFFPLRVEPTQLAFIILGASMAALALMILMVAILATGATRHEVYKSSAGRAGGRIGTRMFVGTT